MTSDHDDCPLSRGPQPCDRCGQLVSARVVHCPRCGHRLREPAVVPRVALEREAAPIPVASPAASNVATVAPVPSEAPATAPVLEYCTPAPPGKPPKEVAKSGGNGRGYLALGLLLTFAVRAWVASDRPSNRPPPAPRPVNIPPRINVNPQVWPGPGGMGPVTSPGGGGVRPGLDDFNGRPLPGTPYSVDSRGRLVDRATGTPVNPGQQVPADCP